MEREERKKGKSHAMRRDPSKINYNPKMKSMGKNGNFGGQHRPMNHGKEAGQKDDYSTS